MITYKKLTGAAKDLPRVEKLYISSFPENERRPLDTLVNDLTGISEFYVFYEEGAFLGFASLLTYKDIAHIIYFAVEPDMRGRGYGSKVLETICDIKRGYRVIADLERPDEDKDSYGLRMRRMGFYKRCGFAETEIGYEWYGENYIILSKNGPVTAREFHEFWVGIESIDSRFGDY